MNQGERLARIEVLLEALPAIQADLRAIRKDIDEDKAELAALKNKGAGILIGVGLLGGSFGVIGSKLWAAIFG